LSLFARRLVGMSDSSVYRFLEPPAQRASALSDLEILVETEVIKRLKARYFRYVDTKQWALFGELFTDDAQFHGALGRFVGRQQIVAHCSRSVADAVTVHHGHQPEIDILDATTARGVWAMDDYNEWPARETRIGIRGYGHYYETYAKQGSTWRISSCRLVRIRVDPIPGGRRPDFLAQGMADAANTRAYPATDPTAPTPADSPDEPLPYG
jgi:hypothetical protein